MALDPQSLLVKLNARTRDKVTALRFLKNEVVGHVQKKEQWVRHGVIRPIVNIIASDALEPDSKGTQPPFLTLRAFTDEDSAKLQALQLLASFANAGPAFLAPLYAAGVLPAVLSPACLQNEHHQIVLAALRVVRDVAGAAAFASPSSPITSSFLADILFTSPTLESIYQILTPKASNPDSEAQISIVAHLIKSLCREERYQAALVSSRILDALATRLASFVVANGQVLPGADIISRLEGLEDYMPEPATSTSSLDGVLGAIAAIIGDSPYRTCKLLYSPSILAVFPIVDTDPTKSTKSPSGPVELPGIGPTKHIDFEPVDLLLPYMLAQSRGHPDHASFPSYGTVRENATPNGRPASKFQSAAASRTPSEDAFAPNNDTDFEKVESPLIPWLITLVRSRSGNEVLMATSILTSLFKAGFSYKTREASLGLLVVPVLLSILNEVETKMRGVDYSNCDRDTASMLNIIEEAPAILARLITDSEPLQKAAFDCGAVRTVCKLLKDSYDVPPPLAKSWTWSTHNKSPGSPSRLPPECRLGEEGEHRYLVHRVKVRESTLRAIGALATFKDEYRKAIVDQEAIHYIVESVAQNPGNPIPVVIAACYAVRTLSRSVNILRTALVDHAVSMPLFELLRHHDIEVQVAATAAVCNLVMDFSPMREPLVEAGILGILCEHAHSHNPSLRLNALWALKNLVHSSSVDLKKRCVEELESGWLVQLICDDTEDDALFLANSRGDRPASRDIPDDMDEDVDMGLPGDHNRSVLSTAFYKTPTTRAQPDVRIIRLAEMELGALRAPELDPIPKARHDDLGIQEQGLGFIRNLIGGAHSSSSADSANETTEMIDYLFNTLGQDRFFGILASKLRVKVLHPYRRRSPTGNKARVLQPQTKIIESVIYILVHIAASIPRHRQLVVSQTELLKKLAKLFNSKDREVRVALCHLINNLTWLDNASDGPGCSQRALELKKLGFLSKLEALREGDDEIDVRERAKSALWQMKPAAY
ncbi:ARM repeat-containing protein [Durotheca rogersii]|uniref:ARM repeat-containing protein n=1 Tax=Durotheca rogersii TaxID=419775 RepID=UPI002220DD9D|nr:ARM repeat-containing protein [Durotheca rogersii]KAI5862321.1 ARM repeat-containing protein [Durotheca rogersii]